MEKVVAVAAAAVAIGKRRTVELAGVGIGVEEENFAWNTLGLETEGKRRSEVVAGQSHLRTEKCSTVLAVATEAEVKVKVAEQATCLGVEVKALNLAKARSQ